MFGMRRNHDGKAVVTADVSSFTHEQLEVLSAYRAMQQAMVDADHEALRAIVEEGTTFTHMSGKTQTREEFIDEVGGPLTYYHSDVRDVRIRVDGDWALLEGTVALTANAYGARGTFPLTVRQYLISKLDRMRRMHALCELNDLSPDSGCELLQPKRPKCGICLPHDETVH